MNKNGFSLIELLAVVLIIAILAIITIPSVGNIIESSKLKAYEEQIAFIESAAKNWSISNDSLINDTGDTYVSLKKLMDAGYIDQDKLVDPITQRELTGCVKISYDGTYNKYVYKYGDYGQCN